MKLIDLNTLSEFPEDFLFAKVDIEKKLIDDEKIDRKMSLGDFIKFLHLDGSIYMENGEVIPFTIIEGSSDKYMIYTITGKPENYEVMLEHMIDRLKKIKFNVENLKSKSNIDIINNQLDNEPFFLINGEFCV